jgi:hypothetical protein
LRELGDGMSVVSAVRAASLAVANRPACLFTHDHAGFRVQQHLRIGGRVGWFQDQGPCGRNLVPYALPILEAVRAVHRA